MEQKRKVGYVSPEGFVDRIRKQFSPEYVEFLLIQMGHSPKVCPKCGTTWRIPRTILHGDEKALAAALPENLKLIPQK